MSSDHHMGLPSSGIVSSCVFLPHVLWCLAARSSLLGLLFFFLCCWSSSLVCFTLDSVSSFLLFCVSSVCFLSHWTLVVFWGLLYGLSCLLVLGCTHFPLSVLGRAHFLCVSPRGEWRPVSVFREACRRAWASVVLAKGRQCVSHFIAHGV